MLGYSNPWYLFQKKSELNKFKILIYTNEIINFWKLKDAPSRFYYVFILTWQKYQMCISRSVSIYFKIKITVLLDNFSLKNNELAYCFDW